MKSTRLILRYIQMHKDCTYIDIANSLFKCNETIACRELHNLYKDELVEGYTMREVIDGHACTVLHEISLNNRGQQFLEEELTKSQRFWVPIIISIVALIVSFIALINGLAF